MAKDRRYTLRLYDDVQSEMDIIEYLSALPKPRRAEELRAIVKAGFALLNSNVTPFPVNTQSQPPVQPTAAPTQHMDVPQKPKEMAVQEVDQTPDLPSLDHREDEAPQHNASTESDSMDAADPLAKMKAKLGG